MELEPMSSFHFESSLPSSQTDPVGDVDEIPEFENNFELENNTNLEEISVKKCDICQETIRNPKFKKHVKYCKLYFQFWTRTPTGFKCKLCLQKLKKSVHKHFEAKHCTYSGLQCQFCKAKHGDKQALLSHMNTNHREKKIKSNTISKKYCKICKEMFSLVGRGAKHVENCKLYFKFWERNVEGFQCLICTAKFMNKYTTVRHLKLMHSNIVQTQNSETIDQENKTSPQKPQYSPEPSNNLQNPDKNKKETHKEKFDDCQEMISGEKNVQTSKTQESLQGENAMKKCEICQEMVGLGFSIHVNHCRLYFKFTKKYRNGYKCKLCPFENYTSNAQKLVHRHIKENHSNVNEAVQNSKVFESQQKDHNLTPGVDKEEKVNKLEKEGKLETMKKCVVILKQLNLDHKKLGVKERETSVAPQLVQDTSTGKSLSEALIFASTNPQYDSRLFID